MDQFIGRSMRQNIFAGLSPVCVLLRNITSEKGQEFGILIWTWTIFPISLAFWVELGQDPFLHGIRASTILVKKKRAFATGEWLLPIDDAHLANDYVNC